MISLEELLESFEKRIVEVTKQRDAAIESGLFYKQESGKYQRQYATRPHRDIKEQPTHVLLEELKRRIEERDDD